jgi:hypothetical protein
MKYPDSQQQVFWFQITMDDMLLMAEIQSPSDVSDVFGRRVLREISILSEHFVQLAAGSKLQNDVNSLLVVEIAIHAENILVTNKLGK